MRKRDLPATPSPLLAIPLMILSGLGLSTLDATAKYLGKDYSVTLITWARYAGHLAFVMVFAYRHRGWNFLRTHRLRMQLLRSTFLLAATLCFFSGLRFVPIAEATAVAFLAPVFIVILAQPMLGEHVTRARWLSVALGFAGVVILVRPGTAIFQPATILLLGMALFNALYQLLTRKLADEDPYTSLFYSALVGSVATTLALPWTGFMPLPRPEHIPLFVLLGLFGGGGHLLLIQAYRRAPAAMITPFAYLQIIWAALYGVVLFQQLPDALTGAGMALIVASGLWLALSERRRARAAFVPGPPSD